jgi:thioredoxin reductase
VGAGPSGIQMGHFFRENYLILEKTSEPCSFFRYFPRQRKLISFNRKRNLRYDWNSFLGSDMSMRDYSDELFPHADDYLRYVHDFIKHHGIQIKYNFEVSSITKQGDIFYINDGEFTADRVFVGFGVKPRPIDPEITFHPKLTAYTYADMPLDKKVYEDKNVLVIGAGNAGLETVNWLTPIANKITLLEGKSHFAYETHFPGDKRISNSTCIDSYLLKQNVHLEHLLWRLRDDTKFLQYICTQNKFNTMDIDIIIFCHGFVFDGSLIKDLVDINGFPVLTPHFESTKTPGLFIIGTAMQQHDYRKGTSSFIGGYRYNCEYIYRHLTNTVETHTCTREDIVKIILNRLSESSCLFHRFSYFCDLVGILENGVYEYIQEIPLRAVKYYVKSNWKSYFTVGFGYHLKFESAGCGTNFSTISNIAEGHKSKVIHPIFVFEKQMYHLVENEWFDFTSVHYEEILKLFIRRFEGEMNDEQLVLKMKEAHEKISCTDQA